MQERPVKNISAAKNHSLVLDNQGNVYEFGNSDINRYIPTLIIGLNNIIAISTGSRHILLLNNQGQVYSREKNEHG